MKDVVDKCSTKGCAIDIGTVIDNDNCTSKFSRFFATREEAESFMTKLKELAAAASSADEGASVAYKIKDLEGPAWPIRLRIWRGKLSLMRPSLSHARPR